MILIVEDDENIQEIYATVLEDEGYSVYATARGSDALEQLAHWQPELILLDWRMPGMDGATFLATMHERGSHIPVLVVSADCRCATDVKQRGAAFLGKPFEMDELLEAVWSACHDKVRL